MPNSRSITPVFYGAGAVLGLLVFHGMVRGDTGLTIGAGIGVIIAIFIGWFNEMS